MTVMMVRNGPPTAGTQLGRVQTQDGVGVDESLPVQRTEVAERVAGERHVEVLPTVESAHDVAAGVAQFALGDRWSSPTRR
jgi:hypothetical protein